MSTNKYMTSDGAGPMDSQGYVQSDWECVSGHSKLQHNGESTLSVGSCWPYPAGREAVPRVAPPLGGRLGVQHPSGRTWLDLLTMVSGGGRP